MEARTDVSAVPVPGLIGRPIGEALMMLQQAFSEEHVEAERRGYLARQHNVLGTTLTKEVGPLVSVEELSTEAFREVCMIASIPENVRSSLLRAHRECIRTTCLGT